MQLWVYLSMLAVASAYVLMWFKTRKAREMLKGLPSFIQLPFIGSLHHLFGRNGGVALYKLFENMLSMSELHNKPSVFWVGPTPVLTLIDLEDIKLVSNTFIEKPYYYDFGKIWLGNGLVTAPGALWKRNIKKLSGLFTNSVVESFLPIFNVQAEKLVRNLRLRAGGPPVNIMNDLSYTTLEAICQTALGVACISDSVGTEQYYKAFNRSLELLVSRGVNILLHPECVYRLTSSYAEMKQCVAVIHGVSDTVMKQRKLHKEETKRKGHELDDAEFKSVIDILLELGDEDPLLTEQQIRSEVDTIIVGGQETVATTVLFTILMLGRYPEIQDRLYNEIKSIYGDNNRPIEKADLSRMPYCEAIINETLRLYPPFPGVMRYVDKDLQLKSCIIPAGSAVLLNSWSLGRSHRYWGSDALEYKPERWLQEQPPGPAAAFLPFSYGRRACIGKRYAMTILKTILMYCVRELTFKSELKSMQFKIDLALRAVSGHLVEIKLRK